MRISIQRFLKQCINLQWDGNFKFQFCYPFWRLEWFWILSIVQGLLQLTINEHDSSIYRDLGMVYTNDNWFVILLSHVYFRDWVTKIWHFSLLKTNNSLQLRTQVSKPLVYFESVWVIIFCQLTRLHRLIYSGCVKKPLAQLVFQVCAGDGASSFSLSYIFAD